MTNQRGFTVIEVLIASFILFLVITSASLIFSSTVKSKQAATQSLLLYSYVPILMDHIDVQIQHHNKRRDEQTQFMEISYAWRATLSERKQVDFEDGAVASINNEAFLWDVSLTVFVNKKKQNFDFKAVSWQRL